ncbi:MAG: 1-(5-phosphoribosyl)-5-[(5-phosphoribosylamino)methylideneamino]imidazole-4-carboxamide isomerase [bacterium]
MLIIPAIDIRDGNCVRLIQGDYQKETIYSNDPILVAKKWESEGAKLIHLVDLDGALHGLPKNIDTIKQIITSISIPVQIGGGIRNIETIDQYFELGVERVILGTKAIESPQFVEEACKKYPRKIIIGIDAKDGKVATKGWTSISEISATELAKKYDHLKLAAIIFTDINRDGLLAGPNLKSIRTLAESISTPVIASGGISSYKDVESICALESLGVEGIIIGKALYTGAIGLKQLISQLT